jgi:hypothetical protein
MIPDLGPTRIKKERGKNHSNLSDHEILCDGMVEVGIESLCCPVLLTSSA